MAGVWFPGSAWERYVLQAPPAVFVRRDRRISDRGEAEPRRQCVPRQSLGTSEVCEPSGEGDGDFRPPGKLALLAYRPSRKMTYPL
jgi:hypothetical protein